MLEQELNIMIILLSSIAVGMILGLIFKHDYVYHGPNAKKYIQNIYHNHGTDKYYKLGIILV
jgi:hypothetical protein